MIYQIMVGLSVAGLWIGCGNDGKPATDTSTVSDGATTATADSATSVDSATNTTSADSATDADTGPLCQEGYHAFEGGCLPDGECSIEDQDCYVDGYKCTLVLAGDGTTNEARCVQYGAKLEGEACTRTPPNNEPEGVGHDDCGPDLFCSGIGLDTSTSPPTRKCRRFCKESYGETWCDTDGTLCTLGYTRDVNYIALLCMPQCEFVTNVGCDAGWSCDYANTIVGEELPAKLCRTYGSVGEGQVCTLASDCARNLTCAPRGFDASDYVCWRLCQTEADCLNDGELCGNGTCYKP